MQMLSRFTSSWCIPKWSWSLGLGMSLAILLAMGVIGCGASSEPAGAPAEAPAPAAQPQSQAAPLSGGDASSQGTQPTTAPGPTGPETRPAEAPADESTAQSPPSGVPSAATEPEPAASEPQPTAEQAAVPQSEPSSPDTPEPEPTEVFEVQPTGTGYVIGEGSEATFTVNEKLAWLDLPNDAVMRTTGLSGSIYLDGQPSVIELDLHSMTSDSDRRDGYVRNRMFPNDRAATFTVTDLGELPDPLPEGEEVARSVAGELAIQGVAKPIVFEVTARRDPDKLFILGRTSFTWDELEIPPPNIPGRIQVKDEVSVEVLLSAVPEGN